MPYRIAVVDDDERCLSAVCSLIDSDLKERGIPFSLHPFASPAELDEEMFDAYFLDIAMPYEDGIQFALSLRDQGSLSCIVFISSIESRVFEAMRALPLRFVRKSKLDVDLKEALNAVLEQLRKAGSDNLVITSSYQAMTIPVNRILYVEGFDKKQNIVTAGKTYTVYESMDWFEKELAHRGFFRIQRSYLVNMSAVTSIEGRNAVMSTGVRLPISRFKTEETRKILTGRFFTSWTQE